VPAYIFCATHQYSPQMGADIVFLCSLILVPFTGTLVRYRASYYPRSAVGAQAAASNSTEASSAESQTSASIQVSSAAEPVVASAAPSFLGVFKSVRRIEVSR
jgi:hypothetical protein